MLKEKIMWLRLLPVLCLFWLGGCTLPLPVAPAQPEAPQTAPYVGEWQSGATMPTPRSEMPVAVVDGIFYVPGGFGGVSSFEAYDPAADMWTTLASLPQGRHHLMATGHQGQVYLFGGAQGTSWLPTNTTWRYDPADDAWTEETPMPETRMAGVAVSLGDFIYVIGGMGGTQALLRYDPAADSWEALAALPRAREHVSAVSFENEIYVLGGRWSDAGALASVDIYDPESDAWRSGVPMQEARSGFGATVVDGKIAVAGGEILGARPWIALASAEIYDPEDGWTYLPALPVTLHGLPLAAEAGALYALGGSDKAGDIDNHGRVLYLEIGRSAE
jgi:N-acetylneuraminic acid mutarotase